MHPSHDHHELANPSPGQTSPFPNPESNAARKWVLVIVATGLSSIVAGATTWGAFNDRIGADQRLLCGVIAALCWLPLAFFARRGIMGVLRARRLFTERCIHCGYPHHGLETRICPECGKDLCE